LIRTSARRTAITASAAAGLFVGGVLAAGCPSEKPSAAAASGASETAATADAARPPVHFFVGADVSGSTTHQERRKFYFALEDALFKKLARKTPVTIWLYDTVARRIADEQTFRRKPDLQIVKKEYLAYESDSRGTRQAEVLTPMLAQARKLAATGAPVACLLLTDGEDDDPGATKKVARALAALDNVKVVWIVGALAENQDRLLIREGLSASLEPLGDKGIVTGTSGLERDSGLEKFGALVAAGGAGGTGREP